MTDPAVGAALLLTAVALILIALALVLLVLDRGRGPEKKDDE